jgi:hypothetical protein
MGKKNTREKEERCKKGGATWEMGAVRGKRG